MASPVPGRGMFGGPNTALGLAMVLAAWVVGLPLIYTLAFVSLRRRGLAEKTAGLLAFPATFFLFLLAAAVGIGGCLLAPW